MGHSVLSRYGAWLVLLGGGLSGPVALADERWVRAQVSVLASQRNGLDAAPEFMPWANLGVALRTRAEAETGWHVGADLSLNLGRTESSYLPTVASFGLVDQGSSVFVRYRPEGWAPDEGVSLTLYPADSSRLRLGWAQPATWAGNYHGRWEETTRGRTWTPGVLLQARGEGWHAFAALKGTGVTGALTPMVGAGVALPLALRAEVQAAHVPRHDDAYPGLLTPDFSQLDSGFQDDGAPVQEGSVYSPRGQYAQGVSARLVHERGGPIGDPVDFGLYGGAPTLFEELSRPETYTEGVAHSVSLEATHAIMFSDWGLIRRSTHTNILALDARLRWNRLRLYTLGLVRGAGAVVLDDGYLWAGYARGSQRRPELGLSLGADYHLASLGLTPGLGVRVLRPAAHWREELMFLGQQQSSWWLISSEGMARVAPAGSLPQPLVSARASLKWNPVPWGSVVGELAYTWADHTLSGLGDSAPILGPERSSERVLDSAGLGFNLLVQARF